jgi:hypothetical protein
MAWDLGSGVWSLEPGVWNLASRISNTESRACGDAAGGPSWLLAGSAKETPCCGSGMSVKTGLASPHRHHAGQERERPHPPLVPASLGLHRLPSVTCVDIVLVQHSASPTSRGILICSRGTPFRRAAALENPMTRLCDRWRPLATHCPGTTGLC